MHPSVFIGASNRSGTFVDTLDTADGTQLVENGSSHRVRHFLIDVYIQFLSLFSAFYI